jgi:hypothetical protein
MAEAVLGKAGEAGSLERSQRKAENGKQKFGDQRSSKLQCRTIFFVFFVPFCSSQMRFDSVLFSVCSVCSVVGSAEAE